MRRIAILGGGSWGTALAIVLSRAHRAHEISLWVRDAVLAESMRRERENKTYLPGHKLPDSVHVTHEMDQALVGAGIILGAVPSAHAREVYSAAGRHAAASAAFVSATKGLEPATHKRVSEVIAQVVPPELARRIADSFWTVVRSGSSGWPAHGGRSRIERHRSRE